MGCLSCVQKYRFKKNRNGTITPDNSQGGSSVQNTTPSPAPAPVVTSQRRSKGVIRKNK